MLVLGDGGLAKWLAGLIRGRDVGTSAQFCCFAAEGRRSLVALFLISEVRVRLRRMIGGLRDWREVLHRAGLRRCRMGRGYSGAYGLTDLCPVALAGTVVSIAVVLVSVIGNTILILAGWRSASVHSADVRKRSAGV